MKMNTPVVKQIIEINPEISGGKPHIAGHRITVQNIVVLHELLGLSIDEISSEYDLTIAEIYTALAYYYENKSVIDQTLLEDEEIVSTLKRQIASKL